MAGDTVGRGSYELDADLTKVRAGLKEGNAEVVASGKQTEDAYAKTGTRAGAALKTGIVGGAKVAAGGAALAFGAATKGGLELENVMARFQAETGASADESKRAALAINRAAGENRVSLESVASAAEKIRTDLGVTGDQADQLTMSFTKYARVTRQDAGGAVSAFDDILDSWNLTADDAEGLMNQLIVSHQKFGGSVTENQATLAALAPSMKAANFEIGDGIELLNLFGAKGLSANMASAAFSKALTKVKSPAELKTLIADISATEDPFLRSQKAADLFGAKAGAKLANALGGVHLDDFAVTAEDAAGALEDANAALDSTFSAQVQKRISQAGAAIREFGLNVGPAVTGLASLASIAGALKLDTLIAKSWSAVASSGAVKAASAAAGAAGAAVYQAAASVTGSFESALSGLWSKMATSGPVMAAATAAGGAAGTALMVGMGAAAFIGVALVAKSVADGLHEQEAGLSKQVDSFVTTATMDGLINARNGIKAQLDSQRIFGVIPYSLAGERQPLEHELDKINKAIADSNVKTAFEMHAAWGQKIPAAMAAGGEKQVSVTQEYMSTILSTAKGGNAKLIQEHQEAGRRSAGALAQGILAKRQEPVNAMDTLRQMLKDALSPAKEDARLLGELTSKDLAKGLKSKDPAVRAQAEFTKQTIIDRLQQLPPASFKHGGKASAELARALKSKDPDIRRAAEHVAAKVEGPLKGVASDAYGWGASATKKYAAGLNDATAMAVIRARARYVSGVISDYWRQKSPAKEGPLSEDGGSYGWGRKAGELFAEGLIASGRTVDSAFNSVMGYGMPGMVNGMAGGGASLQIGGTARVEFTLSAEAAQALRGAGYSESEVAGALRAGVDLSNLANTFRHVTSMRSG